MDKNQSIIRRAQEIMRERGGREIIRDDVYQAQNELGAQLDIAKK